MPDLTRADWEQTSRAKSSWLELLSPEPGATSSPPPQPCRASSQLLAVPHHTCLKDVVGDVDDDGLVVPPLASLGQSSQPLNLSPSTERETWRTHCNFCALSSPGASGVLAGDLAAQVDGVADVQGQVLSGGAADHGLQELVWKEDKEMTAVVSLRAAPFLSLPPPKKRPPVLLEHAQKGLNAHTQELRALKVISDEAFFNLLQFLLLILLHAREHTQKRV